MLTAKDLIPSLADSPEGPVERAVRPAPLVPGSATARALLAAWRGAPLVVVDSPPGGGKTEAAVTIAAHLAVRAGLHVVAAFPTRLQAISFAGRVVRQVPPERVSVAISNLSPADLPVGVGDKPLTLGPSPVKGGTVTVRTVASLAMTSNMGGPDHVLIVDEGYQVTLADMTAAAAGFPQVMSLGDPGQIGPVVTHDVSLWEYGTQRPHAPALGALKAHEDATVDHIDGTWRLGPETVAVLKPCYPFPFESRRPARSASLGGAGDRGRGLGEIERLVLPADEDEAMRLVASRAASLVGAVLSSDRPSSSSEPREATQRDIAVIVSKNVQVTAISALLAGAGLGDIVVGTADRTQGGQWAMVVAVDPCYGASHGDTHATDNGRACVMLSRHTTHLTWAHDDAWDKVLDDKTGLKLRRLAMAAPLAA